MADRETQFDEGNLDALALDPLSDAGQELSRGEARDASEKSRGATAVSPKASICSTQGSFIHVFPLKQ